MSDEMKKIAKDLVAPKKGILAADWSLGTSEKQFGKNNIEHTEENRKKYREILFTTPGLEEFISGVILFDEALRQGLGKLLEEKGIISGIKVDKGMKDMANFPGEKVSEGLDGLRDRLNEYRELGAKFTKWRSAILIGEGLPTQQCIESNAEALARYAALSQEAGLVPVVEPEVLMSGKHSIGRSEEVSRNVLTETFSALERHRVKYDEMILKTNFVHPGKESGEEIDHQLIAEETLQTFDRTLPVELPGVVFLSGGDSSEAATMHLNWVVKKRMEDRQNLPWEISFSFARAIQYPAIEIWGGKDENVEEAQKAVLKRARLNSLARQGKYDSSMEES
jgi:fructose-bisphosphate aldolase class I